MPRRPWLDDPIIEEDPEWIDILPGGEVRNGFRISLSEEDYQRMYDGWVCAWCLQIWEEQWPRHCTMPGCYSGTSDLGRLEMSPEYQRDYLDKRFGGKDWLGPSRSTIQAEQNALDRATAKRATGIWVPGDPI